MKSKRTMNRWAKSRKAVGSAERAVAWVGEQAANFCQAADQQCDLGKAISSLQDSEFAF